MFPRTVACIRHIYLFTKSTKKWNYMYVINNLFFSVQKMYKNKKDITVI